MILIDCYEPWFLHYLAFVSLWLVILDYISSLGTLFFRFSILVFDQIVVSWWAKT